jgi:hypothetical protein
MKSWQAPAKGERKNKEPEPKPEERNGIPFKILVLILLNF